MPQHHSLQEQLQDLQEKIVLETHNHTEAVRSDQGFNMARQIRRKITLLQTEAARILQHLRKRSR